MASIYPDHGLGGKNGEITDAIFEDSLKVGRDLGQSMLNDALEQIVSEVNTRKGNYVVFNDLSWNRSKWVEVPVSSARALVRDEQGNKVASQVLSDIV